MSLYLTIYAYYFVYPKISFWKMNFWYDHNNSFLFSACFQLVQPPSKKSFDVETAQWNFGGYSTHKPRDETDLKLSRWVIILIVKWYVVSFSAVWYAVVEIHKF